MPWVRLSDDWYDDPDLIAAGPAAMLVWPLLISWSARNLQDGKLPAGQIRRLVDWTALGVDPEQAIAPLVATGRLQAIADGYQITNYHRYQPTKAKVLEDREASKGRAARSRDRAQTVREACADAAPAPVPDPVPSPSSSSTSDLRLPADLWKRIAEKQATTTKAKIGNLRAWTAKAAANAEAELSERALWLVENYDLPVAKLVDVLVLPNNPPWLQHHRRMMDAPDGAA